ncbi:MAG: asparaginase [Elusimicrobia bacterium]|nr:asparaginase [Elusimicrobiota bacterium]
MSEHSVLILVTGGTFDKEYDEISGRLFFKQTHLAQMLALGRARLKVRIRQLMLKDSLFMTGADRAKVAAACRAAREKRIMVTHGTDTMVKTARFVAEALAGSDKTVVFTGAMIPYAFGTSDGLFNLGAALAYAQALPPGSWVAMNGKAFPAFKVRKDRRRGRFVPL